jgi:uncharacterized protein YunC (DUF1805 family)
VEHHEEQAEVRHRLHCKELKKLQQVGATGFKGLQDMLEAKFAELNRQAR